MALPIAMGTSACSVRGGDTAASPDLRPHERYSYLDVIEMLKQDDSVLPSLPPVAPVHTLYNAEAIVPSMCYTRTEGTHNPCYVCHQEAIHGRPNMMNDGELQVAYSFSDVATQNHWRNLFEDRTERVAAISDDEILEWIGQDNYSELAPRLRETSFEGYIPDLENLQLGAEAFDEEGFARDGSHWVAFSYKPLPSTFWPTNGSTDDVMVRLSDYMRTTTDGAYSRDVYKANLAIVEASIKGLDRITVHHIDERTVGVDLDEDGTLGVASHITKLDAYVGAGHRTPLRPFLFPPNTEFLHTVRYVGVDDDGAISPSTRMKEVRYMRRFFATPLPLLHEQYIQEQHGKAVGELPGYINRGDHGLDNEMGWFVTGFIENANGRLRRNTYEENLYCMGCHTSVGSTIDNTFSFARKVDGADGWGYLDLHGMPDAPTFGESKGEIATYLDRVGGGGEFRSNPEMAERWFDGATVKADAVTAAPDVYSLITPSRDRALTLNKAYRTIVEDQTFIFGRDAFVAAPANVYDEVDNETSPTLPKERTYRWGLRLDWSAR